MTRRTILSACALVSLAGCVRDHVPGATEVEANDCVACHQADYDGTTSPVHAGQFPDTCGDCHSTDGWQPALGGGHPEGSFPIASGPHELACLDCHDPTAGLSANGANTNCIGCHTGAHSETKMNGSHQGVADYAWDDSMPHFCLTCHPNGRAGKHPESKFPITSGPHEGVACYDCHDTSLGPNTGGQNVSCIGCHEHDRSRVDNQHDEVGSYQWDGSNPDFCRRCHPNGRGGD